uniref:Uncharacterized protein n=1 Tax=Anguilla anguilla TaxID=7936 RepID=A0A0E9RHD4_ANGAN
MYYVTAIDRDEFCSWNESLVWNTGLVGLTAKSTINAKF